MNDALEEVDTPEKHIERIDGWIRALTNEAHFQDERVHLLKPLVLDTEVRIAMKAKLDKTRGVALWNHLAPLLGQDYIRDLARLFLDKGGKTGSLTNIWKKLQVPGIRDHYREVTAVWMMIFRQSPLKTLVLQPLKLGAGGIATRTLPVSIKSGQRLLKPWKIWAPTRSR